MRLIIHPCIFSAGEGFGGGMTRTKAVITHEGLVSLNVPTIMESSCKIHVDNYPFDQQNCELKFGSWTYDGFRIALVLEVNLRLGSSLTNLVAHNCRELSRFVRSMKRLGLLLLLLDRKLVPQHFVRLP